MAQKQHAGSHGSKKYGRTRNKPCQKRYTSEKRWIKNKRARARKYANKFGQNVKIKISGEFEIVKPEAA